MTKIYGLYELLSLKISSFKPKKPVFEGGAGLPGGISPDLLQPRPWENFLSFFFGLPHCISRLIIFESLNFFLGRRYFLYLRKIEPSFGPVIEEERYLSLRLQRRQSPGPQGMFGCRV